MSNNDSIFHWDSPEPDFDEIELESKGFSISSEEFLEPKELESKLTNDDINYLKEARDEEVKEYAERFDESKYSELLQKVKDLIGGEEILNLSGVVQIVSKVYESDDNNLLYVELSEMILSKYATNRQISPVEARLDSCLYFILEMSHFLFRDRWIEKPVETKEYENSGVQAISTLINSLEDISKVNIVLELYGEYLEDTAFVSEIIIVRNMLKAGWLVEG